MLCVEIKCPVCGSYSTDIYDSTYSDEGIRLTCHSCGFREYRKDIDDFDYRLVSNIEAKVQSNEYRLSKQRTRANRRFKSRMKALRKRNISDAIYFNHPGSHYYNNLHQFSKNKIHCSCPLCSSKTNSIWGKHPKISDLRKCLMDE